jgi:hypothetical protein
MMGRTFHPDWVASVAHINERIPSKEANDSKRSPPRKKAQRPTILRSEAQG